MRVAPGSDVPLTWVRFGEFSIKIHVEVVASTSRAIAGKWPWPDDTEHHASFLAGAVDQSRRWGTWTHYARDMTTSQSEGLEPDPWNPFDSSKIAPTHGDLALRSLRYLAAFTRLNDNAGWFLRGWIDHRPESAAANSFTVSELRRLGDERMVSLVRAAASDLQSGVILDEFKGTFSKVKAVRDHLAHAMFTNLMDSEGTPSFGIPYYHGEARVRRLESQVSSVDDRILGRREPELLWLLEIVEWLAQENNFRMGPGSLNREIPEAPRARP